MKEKKAAELHILTEYSPFAMGFVIITPEDRAIIIDGGWKNEFPNILDHVGDREIAAWILTHPDGDHIGALLFAMRTDHAVLDRVKAFYYNFPTAEFCAACEGGKATKEIVEFEVLQHKILDRSLTPVTGDEMVIDGLHIEFLFHRDDRFTENVYNDASLAFRITGAKRNVLFLGDLGPIAGEALLAQQGSHLRSDVVQMAHHGHACVKKDVYEAISPNACIWCCQPWLYREREEKCYGPDMYGTMLTRRWMDELGVTEHYVTGDGDQMILI